MNLLVPAAGRSTRFPGMRPKWMLTHPNGNLMIAESVRKLDLKKMSKIYLVILKEHVDKYCSPEGIRQTFRNIGVCSRLKIVLLEKATRNQPETVATAIKKENIKGPVFIKDSDNSFACDAEAEDAVAIYDLNKMSSVNPANKSYVSLNDDNIVTNIIEKQITSSLFCAGGYLFKNADEYVKFYNELEDYKNLYISHIIFKMILQEIPFKAILVSDYVDWGTLQDWNAYKSGFCTLFIDLDGVLVRNSGQYFEPRWGTTEAIKENVDIINKLYDTGKARIIVTTSRKKEYKNATIRQLQKQGIKYHEIIFDLPHSKRIIINDYAKTNPFKSCDSINIKRNATDLKEILKESLRLENL